MNSVFYTDLQLRWAAADLGDRFGFALGVNNLFDKNARRAASPASPTISRRRAHDIPGRYFYVRASFKM